MFFKINPQIHKSHNKTQKLPLQIENLENHFTNITYYIFNIKNVKYVILSPTYKIFLFTQSKQSKRVESENSSHTRARLYRLNIT